LRTTLSAPALALPPLAKWGGFAQAYNIISKNSAHLQSKRFIALSTKTNNSEANSGKIFASADLNANAASRATPGASYVRAWNFVLLRPTLEHA